MATSGFALDDFCWIFVQGIDRHLGTVGFCQGEFVVGDIHGGDPEAHGHGVLHRDVPESADPDAIQRGDAVLDVSQIARWAGCVGNRTTIVPITDAKHDVFLSLAEPRAAAYGELDAWLDWYLNSESQSFTTQSG